MLLHMSITWNTVEILCQILQVKLDPAYFFSSPDDSPSGSWIFSLNFQRTSWIAFSLCSLQPTGCFASESCGWVTVISPTGHGSILPSLKSQPLQAQAFIVAFLLLQGPQKIYLLFTSAEMGTIGLMKTWYYVFIREGSSLFSDLQLPGGLSPSISHFHLD